MYNELKIFYTALGPQNTNLTVSNTFNIWSEFTGRARKQKPYAFATKTK